MNFDPLLFYGLGITVVLIIAAHLATRFFLIPVNFWGIIGRYVAGCLAILAGISLVLDPGPLATLALFIFVAGAATVGSHMLCNLWIYYNRVETAEEDGDGQ